MLARTVEIRGPRLLACGRDAVWLTTDDGEAVALDARGEITSRVRGAFEDAVAFPDGSVVGIGRADGEIAVVSMETGKERFRVRADDWVVVDHVLVVWREPNAEREEVRAVVHALPDGAPLGELPSSAAKSDFFATHATSLFAFVDGASTFEIWSLEEKRSKRKKHAPLRFVGPVAALGDELGIIARLGEKRSKKQALVVLDARTGELRRQVDLDTGDVHALVALGGRFTVLTERALFREEGGKLVTHVMGARSTLAQQGDSWAAYFGEEGGIVVPLPMLCFALPRGAPRVLTPRRPAEFAVSKDALFVLHPSEVDVLPWESLERDGLVRAERAPSLRPWPPPQKATVLGASGNLLRVKTAKHPLLEIIIAHAPGSGEGPLGLERDASVDVVIGPQGLVDELRFTKGNAAARYTRSVDRLAPADDVVEVGVAAPLPELRPVDVPPELERLVELGVLTRAALTAKEARRVAAVVSATPEAERLASALRSAGLLPTARGVVLASGPVDEPQVLARDVARALPKGTRLRLRIDEDASQLTIALEKGTKKAARVVELGGDSIAQALGACFDEAGLDVGVFALGPETADSLQLLVAPENVVAAVRRALVESSHG